MKKTLHLQYNCHRNYSKCQLQIFTERGFFTVFLRAWASPCVILLKFSPDENMFCFTKTLYYRRKKDARGWREKIPRQISHEIPGNLWKFTKTGEKAQICRKNRQKYRETSWLAILTGFSSSFVWNCLLRCVSCDDKILLYDNSFHRMETKTGNQPSPGLLGSIFTRWKDQRWKGDELCGLSGKQKNSLRLHARRHQQGTLF